MPIKKIFIGRYPFFSKFLASCHEVSIAECQTQLVVVSLRDGFVSPGCGSVMSLTYSHSKLHVRPEKVLLQLGLFFRLNGL